MIGCLLGSGRRGGDDAYRAGRFGDHGGEVFNWAHDPTTDALANHDWIGVDEAGHRKPAGHEAVVATKRPAEIADADNDHRAGLSPAQHKADLPNQMVDLVSDTSGAVGVEIGEILPDVGGVDTG